MRVQAEPMICPKCGATMNQHGEKLADPRTREESGKLNYYWGGVLHEMHSCPMCGANASRISG